MVRRFVLAFFSGMNILSFMFSPAFSEDIFEGIVKSYKASDYRKTIQLSESFLRGQPRHAQARYYLANAYLELHQFDLAAQQYNECLSLTKDPTLTKDCQQALISINKYMSSSGAGPNNNSSVPIGRGKGKPSLNAQQEQILREADENIRRRQQDANREIEEIQQQANEDISSIPQRSYRMVGRRMHSGSNPAYQASKQDISAQSSERISRIKDALKREIESIRNEAERRASLSAN